MPERQPPREASIPRFNSSANIAVEQFHAFEELARTRVASPPRLLGAATPSGTESARSNSDAGVDGSADEALTRLAAAARPLDTPTSPPARRRRTTSRRATARRRTPAPPTPARRARDVEPLRRDARRPQRPRARRRRTPRVGGEALAQILLVLRDDLDVGPGIRRARDRGSASAFASHSSYAAHAANSGDLGSVKCGGCAPPHHERADAKLFDAAAAPPRGSNAEPISNSRTLPCMRARLYSARRASVSSTSRRRYASFSASGFDDAHESVATRDERHRATLEHPGADERLAHALAT